ncbi:MAG: hypothetical protein SFW36_03790 [Leptolyngbyaceae cyanobacterium bins.59]|nr:hypothetical protein [Leptolyngbyaceae cyanobacterium bins.59]
MHNQKRSFKKLMAVLGTAGMGAFLSFPAFAQVNSNPSQPSTSPEGSGVLEQCVSESTQTSSQSSYQTGMHSGSQSMTNRSVPNSGLYRVGSSDRSAMADVEAIGPSGMEFSNFASRSSVNPYESITPTGGTSGGQALQRFRFLAFENESNMNRSDNQARISNTQPEAGIPIEGQNRGEYTQRQNEIGQVGYNNSTLSQGTTAESSPIYRVSPSDVNSPSSSSMGMQRSSSSTTSYNVCR